MTPTPKLRFVERDSYSKNGEHFVEPFKVRILQQWWAAQGASDNEVKYELNGEWRDVPLEKEL
jgi:hypothetical protein